jgi:hypothetical protein
MLKKTKPSKQINNSHSKFFFNIYLYHFILLKYFFFFFVFVFVFVYNFEKQFIDEEENGNWENVYEQ